MATDFHGQLAGMDIGEAFGVEQHPLEHVVGRGRQRPQGSRLGLEHRQSRLRQQPGHRHHRGGEPLHGRIVAVSLGDPPRGVDGVETSGADLVGAREHSDGIDRRCGRHRTVHESVEELDVGPMEVAHEVDDGVGVGRVGLVVLEEVTRTPGVVVVDRRQTGRVDQRHVFQRRRWPLHVEPADLPLGEVAQLDVEGAAVAAERQPRCSPEGSVAATR